MGQENRSNRQLAAGAATYAMELDKLSRLTGVSRKQLAEEQKQQLADMRVRAAMAGMSETQQLQLTGGLTFVDQYSKTLGDSLRDMIDNIPDDPNTIGLITMSRTFRESASDLENMTAEQVANFSAAVGREIDQFSKGQPLEQLLKNPIFSNSVQVGSELMLLSEISAEARAKMLAEQAARDRVSEAFLAFETALNNIKTNVLDAIISSEFGEQIKLFATELGDTISKIFGVELSFLMKIYK
jgi:hypothetical protein